MPYRIPSRDTLSTAAHDPEHANAIARGRREHLHRQRDAGLASVNDIRLPRRLRRTAGGQAQQETRKARRACQNVHDRFMGLSSKSPSLQEVYANTHVRLTI